MEQTMTISIKSIATKRLEMNAAIAATEKELAQLNASVQLTADRSAISGDCAHEYLMNTIKMTEETLQDLVHRSNVLWGRV
jgi:hypothetical protein